LANGQGMASLKSDGWQKVKAGITTVEEVLRVAD
jgi:type II secretory ATPase GspE/PulE/Tfp pilus assembly ATPase PilB-like protein